MALLAAGITEPGGMAEQALSWRTLEAWARLTEVHLSPGDFETIRGLSEVYLMAAEEYRHKQTSPPYDVVEINRQTLGRAISAAIRRQSDRS